MRVSDFVFIRQFKRTAPTDIQRIRKIIPAGSGNLVQQPVLEIGNGEAFLLHAVAMAQSDGVSFLVLWCFITAGRSFKPGRFFGAQPVRKV